MTTLCLNDLDFDLDDISSVEDVRESFSKLASNICVREQLEITLKDHTPRTPNAFLGLEFRMRI